jgi:hypothetical protein
MRILRQTLLLAALVIPACGGGGGGAPPATRSFLMGFSPWLYDATVEAQDWVYSKINAEGDVVSNHLEEGVPWQAMYDNQDLSGNYRAELQSRKDRRVPGKKSLVQINPLNISRNGLAENRGADPNEPLTAPWNGYALNSPQVKQAFLNYAKRMVAFMQPDYLLIGVEVNLLIRNAPTLWPAYVDLHQHVYSGIKALYPTLPVAVSVFCVPFFPEFSGSDNLAAQKAGLDDLTPSLDFVAWSLHPFMSGLLAESFPDDYLDRLFAMTSLPIAVSESSYPAQVWSSSSPPLTFNGSPEKQDAFLVKMLEASQKRKALFVIWFCVRDYDALWNTVLGRSEIGLVWRDTGLYDEAGADRKAILTWRAADSLPWAP